MIATYTLRWIVTIFVGILFTGAGIAKLLGDPVFAGWFEEWGLPAPLMYAIGGLEIACVIALAIPRVSSYAALGLVGIAVGAFGVHAIHGQFLAAALPALLAGGAAILVVGMPGRRAKVGGRSMPVLPEEDELGHPVR